MQMEKVYFLDTSACSFYIVLLCSNYLLFLSVIYPILIKRR